MGSGPKHYRMAEYILDAAKKFMAESVAEASEAEMSEIATQHGAMVAQAQVHATLVLAAASAQNIRRNGALEGGTDEWAETLRGAE